MTIYTHKVSIDVINTFIYLSLDGAVEPPKHVQKSSSNPKFRMITDTI